MSNNQSDATTFSASRLVTKSLKHHWRINIAVALGVAAATAVVTGALLVGDSMRGSLRDLTIKRLGTIDYVLAPGRFFSEQVSVGLSNDSDSVKVNRTSAGILFHQAVVETVPEADQKIRRAGAIQVIASGSDFWDLDNSGVRPAKIPEGDQVVLNQSAADQLGVVIGDLVTVRLPVQQAVPADSPLGKRDSESEGLPRLEVVSIVPDDGLGRFSLLPSQQQPLAAFLPLNLVQDALDRDGQANILFIDTDDDVSDPAAARLQADLLADKLNLQLSDFGLKIEEVRKTFAIESDPERTIYDYYSLTSDQLLLPKSVATAVTDSLPESAQPVLTYLANAIDRVSDGESAASVPYSIISAVDSSEALPLDFGDDATGDTIPIVVNDWTAKQLDASVGDLIRIYYFEPETSSGKEVERSFDARLTAIVPITEPISKYRRGRLPKFDMAPTLYNDPSMTPTVPGVTDQDSIDDWDLPFKLTRERSKEDDLYWDHHRLTPKAFIPLAAGQRIFGSRFGDVTSLKIPNEMVDGIESLGKEELEKLVATKTQDVRDALGFAIRPTRALQLAASKGTTPFDALFVSLSFFVIVAALMLVALLFRLGLEQRASEFGTMLAMGLSGKQVAGIAQREGIWISILGSVVGVLGGVLYAKLVLHALRSWWVGAVTVPFLRYHWSPLSITIGVVAGTMMAMLTIWWTCRKLRSSKVASLVSGQIEDARQDVGTQRSSWLRLATIGCFLVAVITSVSAIWLVGQAQAGAFVGGGMMLLAGIVLSIYLHLSGTARKQSDLANYSLRSMAFQSARRNPLRSTLSIGLLAVACFLITSMSAFQMAPTDEGVGGFDVIGRTAVPIYRDLGDSEIRADLLGTDAKEVADADVFGFRFKPGQDASCNNLYQASRPQVLGVPSDFVSYFDDVDRKPRFNWFGASDANPWQALTEEATGTEEDPIPMILDQNTAMFALQMYGGVGEVKAFEYKSGTPTFFKVAGFLQGSVLQGTLLVGEANFEDAFPEISGYQYYMMKAGTSPVDRLASVFEDRLSDSGMDIVESRDVLSRLLAVQNTYLRTFQGLGALGLLLGTFGLATVQLRSVIERRGELAVMRATGFRRSRLAKMVILENGALLVSGIFSGLLASFAAIIPYIIVGRAKLSIGEPMIMLSIVFVVGLFAAMLAVRQVLKMPLLDSLRAG